MLHNLADTIHPALDAARAHEPAVEARLRAAWAGTPLADAGAEHAAGGGKRTRARLTLAAAALTGAPEADAHAAATAVELLHNAALVHDDVIDGDTTRRGQPAVWARHGASAAVLLGDRLLAAAHAEAARSSVPAALVEAVSGTATRLVDGVARERDPAAATPPRDAYLAATRAKTGALFALTVDAALALTDAPRTERERARTAFEALGAAYQIADDMADLDGLKDGRPAGGDIRAGRLCAPLAAVRAHAPAARRAALERALAAGEPLTGWVPVMRAPWVRRRVGAWHETLCAEAARAADEVRPALKALAAWAETRVGGELEAAPCAAGTP